MHQSDPMGVGVWILLADAIAIFTALVLLAWWLTK